MRAAIAAAAEGTAVVRHVREWLHLAAPVQPSLSRDGCGRHPMCVQGYDGKEGESFVKTIIVSTSRSPHGNTRRVAEVLRESLGAVLMSPEQATPELLAGAGRIGFGSGVYNMRLDRRLVECVDRLADMSSTQAFVFATSGFAEPPFVRYLRHFERRLERHGFELVGRFHCRGYDTWGPAKLIGGVRSGHPDKADLDAARTFAEQLVS